MKIELKTYGKLKDIMQDQEISVEGRSVNDLLNVISVNYPQLPQLIYAIAVNNVVVKGEQILNNGDEVCLLPPFAGG